MNQFMNTISSINPADKDAVQRAKKHIDNLTKPLGSLGKLEEIAAKFSGITGEVFNKVSKRNIIVMCSDNGICEEGVSSADQIITKVMTEGIPEMKTGVGVLASFANAELTVVDVGVKGKINNPKVINRKVNEGTANMAKGPAMTREEAIKAIEVGIEITDKLCSEGCDLFGTGEMGIGNTSTSAAVIASLLGVDIEELVGKGVGLTEEQFKNKKNVLKKALKINNPNKEDVIDVISKVGGFDIAGMCGCFLSAAKNKKPIVIDGVISCAAALCAYILKPECKDYMFTSHKSDEKAVNYVFNYIRLEPILYLDMRLGEGSGCPLAFNVIEAALYVVNNMATFNDIGIGEESKDKLVDIREEN
ncbi:nicotinate-nucleotide--dimethylbenzimidazole phosphoribosyltransferase [Clostridium homopropionicum DSM 5847]|uniref:Nicotinate-nucleotide--dimethylbenzimidazole phosphoribosyltransferase n=1 Tax=Clostridium homopropionicum DSM 5847 TaxID=1121318 RepID=A0A0L6Z9W9_9CLOT|nr:nicotinate-nucleotide--dimethylbenzimidazole phosphoribosyltransferase [Clostridium homopropionicum]KOA19764.1 nicotinate-nucleotide--dimethylbenzimidazole phosphoribosyltransferase [Clostridium homopropionicum DSM 5847]SFF78036.1 nicotinate-nucleotide-dimethylbenzimidazole phosphoribosyltransferase [Clostridium homopropionicum]